MSERLRYRVLLVISNLEYGGAQRQVVELTNHLDNSRFDVHICSLSDYVPLAENLGQRVGQLHIIRKRFKYDASVVLRLARLMHRLRVHVAHSFLFDSEIAVRLAGLLAGTPLVVGSERNTNYHLKTRQRIAYRLTRPLMDLCIANSRAGAAFNQRVLGHRPDQYRVVHNGVNTERFRPQDGAAVRRELGIAEDERAIGVFASFKAQKNHPLLLAAIPRVLERFARSRFLLVGNELYGGMHGSNEYKLRIARLLDQTRIRERCLLLGNRDDVCSLYNACDLTVLPSLFEGTPNVVLESLACGVPVVVTDVSDNAHLVPDGRVGFVIPLGDEAALAGRVCDLLANESLRREMSGAARDWAVHEFSVESLARKTEAVYLEFLERKGVNPIVAKGIENVTSTEESKISGYWQGSKGDPAIGLYPVRK